MLSWSKHHRPRDFLGGPEHQVMQQPAFKPQHRKSSGLRNLLTPSGSRRGSEVTPHEQWEAEYLNKLRTTKPARPNGARPPPALKTQDPRPTFDDELLSVSVNGRFLDRLAADQHIGHDVSSAGTSSQSAQQASESFAADTSQQQGTVNVDLSYRENGTRWIERQEAHALREALKAMDTKSDEQDFAASQEALYLIAEHVQTIPAQSETSQKKDTFKSHLRKGAHQRSASSGWFEAPNEWNVIHATKQRTASNGSTSASSGGLSSRNVSGDGPADVGHVHWAAQDRQANTDGSTKRILSFGSLGGRRRLSGRKFSAASGPFQNPEDRIFEERESEAEERSQSRNKRRKPSYPLSLKSDHAVNKSVPAPRDSKSGNRKPQGQAIGRLFSPKYETSRQTSDVDGYQSPGNFVNPRKAPAIPMISVTPGDSQNDSLIKHDSHVSQHAMPSIPVISVSGEDSTVLHHETGDEQDTIPSIPAISVSGDGEDSAKAYEAPAPRNRFSEQWGNTSRSKAFALPFRGAVGNRATAQCAACALPIAGKIVSAASERFHPQCFTCHHCSEALECVAFYPEPDAQRKQRLARISARFAGEEVPETGDHDSEIADGDESTRFYCHLDFHELFSPRCRSCKTPIEKDVVVACGGTWHEGHFFCAECGDPFDEKTSYVEKDGYAWCVPCHAGKFSGKCKGCRRPIVDTVVSALGAEWHEQCFTCMNCGDNFDDGNFFVSEEEGRPRCVRCEEIRLKA